MLTNRACTHDQLQRGCTLADATVSHNVTADSISPDTRSCGDGSTRRRQDVLGVCDHFMVRNNNVWRILGLWYRNCGIKSKWKWSHLSFTHGVNHECQEASQAERRPSGVSSPARLDSLVSRRVDRGRSGRGREHAAPHVLVGPEIDSISKISSRSGPALILLLWLRGMCRRPWVSRSVRPLWVRREGNALGRSRPTAALADRSRMLPILISTSAESHLTIALAAIGS